MNRLPRLPKAAPSDPEPMPRESPTAQADEAVPVTLRDRIYQADVMKLADWLRAATYSLRENHNRGRTGVAIEVFGYGARPHDLDALGAACQEAEIDTADFCDALATTWAVEIATTLQRHPLVAAKFAEIPTAVWEPT